jgi:hypothetical protein
MKYAQWLAAGSLVALGAALLRPDIAHLALRAVLVLALLTAGLPAIVALVRRTPPSPFEADLREYEISSPELPRDLVGLGEELRVRGRFVSETVTARLARELRITLQIRRGLSNDILADERALAQFVSPMAAALVASDGRALLPRRQLESVLHELEHL